MKTKWLIGIDEAGRGPLAGPVSVGVVLVLASFDWCLIPGVGDSKQMSEKNREAVYLRAVELQKDGQIVFLVKMVSAKIIDKKGIVLAIKSAIKNGLEDVTDVLCNEKSRDTTPFDWSSITVKLDGSLRAPVEFVNQETIIKGDSKEKVIGLASILAKVTRDRYMVKISTQSEFENYNFARHKGYGTKVHRIAIGKFGLSSEHRATYCKNIKML